MTDLRGLILEDLTIYAARGSATMVVESVNLAVPEGAVFGIFGKNGSGKTALLRSLLGLIPLSSAPGMRSTWAHETRVMNGRIKVDGIDVTGYPPAMRGMSLVPQQPTLYPDKSLLENLAFPLLMAGEARAQAITRAAAMAASLGLSSVANRRPGQVSGGQQQRTALGRALMREPRLTLLDEPLSSVDVETRRELQPLIAQQLRVRSGMALYVAHDASELSMICDTIAFLEEGRIAQVATPADAYARPATLGIARSFSGFVNTIEGSLESNGSFHPLGSGASWQLPPPAAAAATCTLATRATALVATARSGGMAGRMLNRYHAAGVEYAQVEIGTGLVVTCQLQEELRPTAGVFVHCFQPAQCLLFDSSQVLT